MILKTIWLLEIQDVHYHIMFAYNGEAR